MGQERECKLRYGGKTQSGKAYLETDYILFRGDERLKVSFGDLKSVKAERGSLRLDFDGGPAVMELGDAAAKWAEKILHPPSRLDKLGVKPGTKIRLVGELNAEFSKEAEAGGAAITDGAAELVFLAAEKTADLRRIRRLAAGLGVGSALWVVYPKGAAAIREIEVIEAGRTAGLKDTKVAKFSSTHTALRFAAPKGH
jgi:hypothetical protein